MGPPTPLLAATLKFLSLERTEQIVDWIYADNQWGRIATLAPLAFQFAEMSPPDAVALRIVDEAAQYLAESIRAVVVKLKLNSADSKEFNAGGLL